MLVLRFSQTIVLQVNVYSKDASGLRYSYGILTYYNSHAVLYNAGLHID